jgi:uncharacterized protein (DUF1800 family)
MSNQISRRDFIKLAGFGSAAAALWGCTSSSQFQSTLTPIKPSINEEAGIFAALRRITFGPRPEEIEHARQIGLDAFFEEQLAFDSVDDTDMAGHLKNFTTLQMSPVDMVNLEKPSQPSNELITATLLRAVYSRRQLFEHMVNFWSDHFNIYILKKSNRILKTVDDREVIRAHALGRFRDLLSASMHSPAMLVYLDNSSSSKDRPNENYGRELLELHTLGVNRDFTQQDVDGVVRALTGWSTTGLHHNPPGQFIFRDGDHDQEEKLILGVKFPAGQGSQDGEQLIEILSNHPSTASFIAYKLVRRFVSDIPPADLVAKAAIVFQSSKGDIRSVLGFILHSEEFHGSLGLKLKRPFEYLVSSLRQTNTLTTFDDTTRDMLNQMGQTPFFWIAPNGYPDVGSAWLNTNDLLNRWNFAFSLASNLLSDSKTDLTQLVGASVSPAEMLDKFCTRLIGYALPDDARWLLLNQNDSIKTIDPIISMCALLLASPYFQYR